MPYRIECETNPVLPYNMILIVRLKVNFLGFEIRWSDIQV